MATRQPTPRQLAYLDELKMRLQELRDRQASFMEQTAKILSRMSSSSMDETDSETIPTDLMDENGTITTPAEVGAGIIKGSKGNLNIKKLIQRFEDLRKNSQEFGDLPEVPEELINVDVRRILNGYEKLIEDGHVLQQSWFLLKKSTESCARFASANGMKSEDRPPLKSNSGIVEVVPERSPEVAGTPPVKKSKSLLSNVVTSSEVVDKKAEVFTTKNAKVKCNSQDYGRARWGAFMQLIIRALRPFHGGSSKTKKNHNANNMRIPSHLPPKRKPIY
ncbi:uncharacterized protein LOC6732336 isoform X1 [Drosophila simulans]|uniref:Uncharacterized protein, isoform A n=1 Tax=Drosophila simulans TaxID=7240 RepID=A0A0J9R378_DROSI|nr:uncharacterized protein LOC6732336 isoform X1 [Drosophila simulans]KMY90259.1 uncharacterized protein Dsimw501_GD22001, isoform A [Drosophila simulans]